MTEQQLSAIDAVADVILAAGFDAMAREYRTRPEHRERIAAAMARNIANDRRFGIEKAREFARLARQAQGIKGDFR